MRPKVEKELDNLVKGGVLEPVCQCLSYPYCASPKKMGYSGYVVILKWLLTQLCKMNTTHLPLLMTYLQA